MILLDVKESNQPTRRCHGLNKVIGKPIALRAQERAMSWLIH